MLYYNISMRVFVLCNACHLLPLNFFPFNLIFLAHSTHVTDEPKQSEMPPGTIYVTINYKVHHWFLQSEYNKTSDAKSHKSLQLSRTRAESVKRLKLKFWWQKMISGRPPLSFSILRPIYCLGKNLISLLEHLLRRKHLKLFCVTVQLP